MERVEAEQRARPDLVAPDQEVLHRRADDRDVVDEVRTDRNRPVAQLVPGKQVAREGEAEREQQQHHADGPVELARLLVRARVEHADHVQRDDEHHEMRRPSVDVADQLTEADPGLQTLHVAVGGGRGRRVDEHQVHARDQQDPEEDRSDEPEAERIAQSQHPSRNLDRVDVQEEVAERLQRAPTRRVELRMTEHRAPHVAALHAPDQSAGRSGDVRLERITGFIGHARSPLRRPWIARPAGSG